MAGDWIKWTIGLVEKVEVVRISATLKQPREVVVCKLMKFWEWADANIPESDIRPDGTAVTKMSPQKGDNCHFFDTVACMDGFSSAMESVGWLVFENDTVLIPNFGRHNGETAKTRARNSKYQKKKRKKSASENTPNDAESCHDVVTNLSPKNSDKNVTREEKRREYINPPCIPPQGETTHKRFVPPSLEEVTAYCRERQNQVDPQRWIDHYTANGWRVGANSMKDWRAAVRTWEKSERPQPAQQPPANPETVWAALRKNGIDIEAVKRDVGETWCRAVTAVGGWRVLTECSDFNKPKLDARLIQEFERARNGGQA